MMVDLHSSPVQTISAAANIDASVGQAAVDLHRLVPPGLPPKEVAEQVERLASDWTHFSNPCH